MIIEAVEPLAIEAERMMEVVNKNKENLDGEYFGDNIDKIVIDGNLSPKKIQTLSTKHGIKQKKKSKKVGECNSDKESG